MDIPMNLPPLVIDKNENDLAPHIVESLKHYFPTVLVANLPHREFGGEQVTAGDINIPMPTGDIIAIERKTVTDFLNSIPNRHLMHQVEVMHAHAKYVALVITGRMGISPDDKVIADRHETKWDGVSVRSLIREIQLTPCIVEYCSEAEYSNRVLEIYRTIANNDNLPKTYKNRIKMFPPVDERVQFLAQLPGVSTDRATSLLNFAGMMEGVQPDEDNNTFGSLAQAIHYMTILSHFGKDARPENWGAKTILTNRKFLGLASNQYIGILEEKNETTEE